MTEEELALFDEEEWEKIFDQENPLKEVPEEVIDDIDMDLENE